MNLPTKDHLAFLICEDIRQEIGGKLSLMGCFVGGGILITDRDRNPALDSLCFYYNFADGAGTFRARAEITNPDNEVIFEQELSQVTKVEGENMLIAFKVSPFPNKGLGGYVATVWLDNEPYHCSFKLELRPKE